ncbi:MAG: hypothetical protein ABFD46_08100 [Armatimonadota bacterium]
MAYKSTSGTASNTADMLIRLKDFIIETCGWTLHDDQMTQAQPYFVAFSAGESGREDIYLQFINDAATNNILVKAALYWDASSHTAIKPVFSSGSTVIVTSDSAPFNYWIYVNPDRVYVVTRIGATYYGHYSGVIKRFWSDQIAVTQDGADAGTNVTVSVNDASILSPGKFYVIKDNANIARTQVTATDVSSTPNTVTIASLATAYAAGAKIGEDPQPVMVSCSGMPGGYLLNRCDGYAGQMSHPCSAREFSGYQTGVSDPDNRYRLVAMYPILVTGDDELRGELIDVYSIGSGAGASEDVLDLGTSTYKIFYVSGGPSTWIAVRE